MAQLHRAVTSQQLHNPSYMLHSSAATGGIPICCKTKLNNNLRGFKTSFIYLVAVLVKRTKVVYYTQKQ